MAFYHNIIIIPQDKELEWNLLQSTVHDLRQQLDESEHSRSQLGRTLEELEQDRQSVDDLEAALKERNRRCPLHGHGCGSYSS